MGPQWEKYTPPVRPSEQDMLTIRERLERVLAETGATEERKAQVLVLGSTPETRNMLAGLPNVRVTLMDYMLQMTVAMTEMVTADPFDEVWIKGDWLNAPLPEHYFDAVISDLVLSNLPLGQARRAGRPRARRAQADRPLAQPHRLRGRQQPHRGPGRAARPVPAH